MERKFSVFSALALATYFATLSAPAGPQDYEFRLVDSQVKQGNGATISVSIVDRRTGKPVDDAVVFATRLDMEPDGMEAMSAPVSASPADQPGIYRFKADLIMAGGWRFSIAAKVQGETETVVRRLVLKAVE